MIRGGDSDNYDGPVPETHFKRLYDVYAMRFNIIGLEALMPYAQQQRDACEGAGMFVPFTYKFLYWTPTDLDRMKQAAGFGLPVAIDCEFGTNWEPGRVLERIHQAKDVLMAEGRYWGIYTGEWWWVPKTANSADFKDDPLWHAAYPFGQGVVPPSTFLPPTLALSRPYGGWMSSTVYQYADACYEDNAGDWDFDMNAMAEPLPPAAVDPTLELKARDFHGDAWIGNFRVIYNQGVPVMRYGASDNSSPGRVSRNRGGVWYWDRTTETGDIVQSIQEGD